MLQLTSFPTYTDSLRAFCLLRKMGMAPVRHAEARKGDEKHFGGRNSRVGWACWSTYDPCHLELGS